jgi:hypothetical protein
MWMRQNIEDGIAGFTMGYFTRGLGWSKEEVDVFVAQIRPQINSTRSHMYLPIGFFYGRKPDLSAMAMDI